jgi:NAD-dependent DNA ligase
MNYCNNLRIANIGYQTLDALYMNGFLDAGILSLYKLRKKKDKVMMIEGFGKLKTNKMIREVEAKRRLKDYEFFGAYGIEGLSKKTFQLIFESIPLSEFIEELDKKKFDIIKARLIHIQGIGNIKADILVNYLKNEDNRKELKKLMTELIISETYGKSFITKKGCIVFTGCRPNDELTNRLEEQGYEVSDSWKNSATTLVIPHEGYQSSKVGKAIERGVRIITLDECMAM